MAVFGDGVFKEEINNVALLKPFREINNVKTDAFIALTSPSNTMLMLS